ncbi:hypothetical protein [Lentibacillus cibarius]|uniref:Lipoprotein n=1 Tax=Lentibacillus cibarius TaxID=2583219 RepID=A0A5S3QFZ6_9BACI|nr:hypothetical protein [Lentibacillus cibarius]TMN20854.1 hypothetical protein FFL34_01050 [Lentibacillus cibarius]
MQKKTLFMLLMIGMFLFVAACSSDKEASPDDEKGDTESEEKSEREKVFEETDKIAKKFYKAGFELNIPVAYDMLSPKGKKKLEGKTAFGSYNTKIVKDNGSEIYASDLIKSEQYERYKKEYPDQFKEFEKLHDEYEIRRYDYTYSKESKEIVYYVKPWRNYDFEKGDSNFISLKQNENGEWKVKAFKESIPEEVRSKNSGTILHEYKKYNKSSEGEYGFEDKN